METKKLDILPILQIQLPSASNILTAMIFREISIWTRGYADGTFEVKTAWDGEVLATLEVQYTNVWEKYTAPVTIPDGIQALYLTYRGNGNAAVSYTHLTLPTTERV